MSAMVLAFVVAWLVVYFILRSAQWHLAYSADQDLAGIQKFHVRAVPRIGGVAIFMALCAGVLTRAWVNETVFLETLYLLLAALPVFLAGLIEDVTKRVGVRQRLLAAFLSAAIAGYLLKTWLVDVQLFGLDHLLSIPILSILFTCTAVAGVTNAFNLIDGYHGLVGVVATLILLAIGYVAFILGDFVVLAGALSAIGAILGFLFWNYPTGRIFLGDGGAYLIGFWTAQLSVMLVIRNPEVSKWFPVLACFYPIFETVFTMYRRLVIKRTQLGEPDASHLHQIIYARVVRWGIGSLDHELRNQRNFLTSPYLWLLCSLSVIPAILFWDQKIMLQGFILLFAVSYIWLYRRIVRFRVPKWLILSRLR